MNAFVTPLTWAMSQSVVAMSSSKRDESCLMLFAAVNKPRSSSLQEAMYSINIFVLSDFTASTERDL